MNTWEEDCFSRLVSNVAGAFEISDVKRRAEHIGASWAWSICGLPLRPKRDLLAGLNWGGGGAGAPRGFVPGDKMPDLASALSDVTQDPFIAASMRYLESHDWSLTAMNYFNVVPFRSPSSSCLTDRDWRLGIESFFLDAFDFIAPARTLILGTTAIRHLQRLDRIEVEESVEVRDDAAKRHWAAKGTLVGRQHRGKFFVLPHPSARLRVSDREALWKKLFSD